MTPLEHVVHIGHILDSVGVPWVLGGSMASSVVGEPRSTLDIDVAVELDARRAAELIAAVRDDFYVSAEMVSEALLHGSSFNLVHYESGMKIDVFALSEDPLDRRQLHRRQAVEIEPGVTIWVGSADDQVLRKLRWFRAGGEVSDRQWRDVIAIVMVQGPRLDRERLLADADEFELADLVRRMLAEVAEFER